MLSQFRPKVIWKDKKNDGWIFPSSGLVSGNVLQNRVCFRRNVIFSLLLLFFAGKCVSVYISLWEKFFEVMDFFFVGDCDARYKGKLDCSWFDF